VLPDENEMNRSPIGECRLVEPLLSTVAFRDLSLARSISLADEIGYQGIEIWEKHLHDGDSAYWRDVANTLKDRNMHAPVVAPFLAFTRGPERLKETWNVARHVLAVAAQLGSSRFRIFTDVGNDGMSSASASAECWSVATREIGRLCRENPKMIFVLEVHPFTLADTPDSTTRLLDEISASNFRINFQFVPAFVAPDWETTLRRFLPQIAHMHWHQLRSDGLPCYLADNGLIDFARVATLLADSGYAGTISIEYCWMGVQLTKILRDREFLMRIPEFGWSLARERGRPSPA